MYFEIDTWMSQNFLGAVSRRQGRNEGGQEGNITPSAESLWGHQITAGAPKSPNSVTSTFFNTVHLLPKNLRFEHQGAELCPGRHLTTLCPCSHVHWFTFSSACLRFCSVVIYQNYVQTTAFFRFH